MEDSGKLISVIVPVFQVEKYLRNCIDSIINQTYKNLEIILVDDGSTDGCAAICDDYYLADSRIKVIHKENGGLSDARNSGLDVASGEYITFVDSDDYFALDAISQLYASAVDTDADIVIGNYAWVDEFGKVDPTYMVELPSAILSGQEALDKLQSSTNYVYIPMWSKLYRKSIWDKHRFIKGKQHEDQFLIHELFDSCDKIATISDTIYYYVQRSGSIMTRYNIPRLDEIEAMCLRYDFYLSKGYERFATDLMELLAYRYKTTICYIKPADASEKARYKEVRQMFEKRFFGIRSNRTPYKWLRYKCLVAFIRGDRVNMHS